MGISDYRPGYHPKRKDIFRLAEEMASLQQMSSKSLSEDTSNIQLNPCIAISRKIGVGAVEIADLVGETLSMKVLDRELLEHFISSVQSPTHSHLSHERIPTLGEEILRMLKGQKPFLRSKYAKSLAHFVFVSARTEPCIFVGRGAHLIIQRDKVLAVRIIGSLEYRIKRVASIMKTGYKETERRLMEMDKEQRRFFKSFYGKTGSSPYEFDMVITRDFLEDKHEIAKIIVSAYQGKFFK